MCIFYTHPPPYTRMLHNVEYVCVCRRHFSSTHTVGLSLSHDPIETSHLLRSHAHTHTRTIRTRAFHEKGSALTAPPPHQLRQALETGQRCLCPGHTLRGWEPHTQQPRGREGAAWDGGGETHRPKGGGSIFTPASPSSLAGGETAPPSPRSHSFLWTHGTTTFPSQPCVELDLGVILGEGV